MFKQNFKMSDIFKQINQFGEETEELVVDDLKSTLIALVDRARMQTKSEGGFGNITWNLRGSIVGVIVHNHQIVFTYAPPIQNGDVGRTKGLAYAQEIASLTDDGQIEIIIVAGEDYASYVENRHGLDVISGSCAEFEETFKRFVQS